MRDIKNTRVSRAETRRRGSRTRRTNRRSRAIRPTNLFRERFAVGSVSVDAADLIAAVPVAASLAAGLLAWPALPREMAVHFSGGSPDTYVAKSIAVWLVPAIGLVAIAVVRREATGLGVARAVRQGFVGWIVAIAHVYVVAWNLGYQYSSLVVLVPALGGAALLVLVRKTGIGS